MAQKELLMRHIGNHVEIYYEGGGELPECLKGLFTDKRVAQQHINKYLHDKGRKDATSTSDTRESDIGSGDQQDGSSVPARKSRPKSKVDKDAV